MSIEVRFGVTFAIGLVACTKPNPEFCKEMPNDPMCNPAAPDAARDATADAIADAMADAEVKDAAPDAFTCRAGAFEMCQDTNTSLVCNASGTAFAPTTCPNGCNTTFGCQICAPNQTTCANNNAQTCDSQGNVSSDELCTLGCSTDATRCKTLVPSNNLGKFYTMSPNPLDLTLAGTLDLATGKLTSGGTTTTIASFTVAAPTGGAPIRVFVGKHIVLGDLTVVDTTVTESPGGVGFAIALLATQDLDVTGRVSVATGAVDIAGCTGVQGTSAGNTTVSFTGGRSGGGHASAGANGGGVPGEASGGIGGTASGTATLIPLRGGCPGAGTPKPLSATGLGEHGGGAIQLVSEASITVSGTIAADGLSSPFLPQYGGGGGGGGILLEAPSVTFNPSGKLLARGGGGIDGDLHQPATPLDDASAPPGGKCGGVAHCGDGGNGAAPMALATPGGDTDTPPMGATGNYFAGAGGGGIGRIRINTKDANFTTSSSVVLAADLTAGVVGTN